MKKLPLVSQLKRFAANGVLVTALDFAILNLLSALGVWVLFANIISTSIAMLTSYTINKQWVFRGHTSRYTLVLFLAVTLSGVYVLQGIVILAMYEFGASVGVIVRDVLSMFGINSFSEDFLLLNIAKLSATAVSTIWNFLLYKYLVFKQQPYWRS